MAEKKIQYKIGFSVDKAGLEEMQSYFQRIANQAEAMGDNTNNGLKRAGQTAQTLDKILEKTFNTDLGILNVTKFNQELQKSGLTLKQVKNDLTLAGSQGVIAYNRLAQAIMSTNIQLKQSSKLLDNMFTTFKNTIRYGISSSIFNNFANSIQKAYNYTKYLDTSLNNIRIVTGKSADEMDRFADKANNVAKNLNASTLDYTNAALIYYQQGLSDQEVQARTETTIKVANVTNQAGREVSEQLTAVWNGYKVSAEETELYIDKLAAVAATTAADLEELSTGMSKVASAANAMGVNFDDLNAQIATIVSVTRQAPESVGTALKTIYARLGDLKVDGVDEFGVKLGEITSQMKIMGIEILDQEDNMRDMSSIMAEVAKKWNTWTDAQKQAAAVAMAGKRQYNNLIALFDNWDMYTDALNTSTNAIGTLQKQQDIFMESTEGKLNKLKTTWEDLYKGIGDTKTIQFFITTLTNAVQTLDNFSDSLGSGLKSLSAFGVTIANIFSKQIAHGISNAAIRVDALTQNLALARSIASTVKAGAAESTGKNIHERAIVANTQEQLEIAEKIQKVRGGMTPEEQNLAIEYQKQLGILKEQEITLKGAIEQEASKIFNEEEYSNILLAEAPVIDELIIKKNEEIGQAEKTIEKNEEDIELLELKSKQIQKLIKEYSQIAKEGRVLTEEEKAQGYLKDQIIKLTAGLNKQVKEAIKSEVAQTRTYKDTLKIKDKILNILNQEKIRLTGNKDELLKQKNALEGIYDKKIAIYDISLKQQGAEQQLADLEERAKKVQMINQVVTTTLGTLSNVAMAWSSINSLFKIWSDETVSTGDIITQTLMTLGFTLPMITNNFKRLGESFGVTTGLFQAFIAKGQKNVIINNAMAHSQEYLEYTGKELTKKLAEETILKNTDSVASKKLAAANTKLETSILGVSAATKGLLIGLAAVAAAVGVVALIYSYKKKKFEADMKENEATIERVKNIQNEVNANKNLYDSYEGLYGQYKNNLIEKDKLADTAQKVADKYGIELTALEKLTGQYDEFTERIRKARDEELDKGLIETENKKISAESNILAKMREKSGYLFGDKYTLTFGTGLSGIDETGMTSLLSTYGLWEDTKGLGKFGSIGQGGSNTKGITVDANDTNQLIRVYEKVRKVKEQADQTLSSTERNNSEIYGQIKEWLELVTPAIEDYKNSIEELNDFRVQKIFNAQNFEETSNLEDYNNKIKEVKEQLQILYGEDEEKINRVINAYLVSSQNEFVKTGVAADQLRKKLGLVEEEWEKIDDKEFLIKGEISISSVQGGLSADQINTLIELAKKTPNEQDFNTITSLREKVSSGSKLSKTDLKEKLEEETQLAKEFQVEFSNFEEQSLLKELDTLNYVLSKKIKMQQDYLAKSAEYAKKELDTRETQLRNFQLLVDGQEEEYLKLTNDETFRKIREERIAADKQYFNALANKEMTDEIRERFKNARAAYTEYIDNARKQTDALTVRVEELNKIIKEGLDPDIINDSVYDMLISGIDGVISEVKILKNLTADIGEDWVVAADKIEDFARNFPELLNAQENYNILADGNIQITEKGKEALKDELAFRKDIIAEEVKAYSLEIQKQIDLNEISARYYRKQAKAIRESIGDEEKSTKLKAQLEQNLANYIGELSDLTGMKDSDITQQILDNSKIVKDIKKNDAQAEYDYYYDVGKIIEAAFNTEKIGKFIIPDTVRLKKIENTEEEDRQSKQYNKTKYEEYFPELKELSDEDKEALANQFDSLAQELEDENIILNSKKIAAQVYSNYDFSDLGKSKKSSKDKDKNIEDEFDRYYDIKKAIDLVNNALDKLSKIQERLHGKELIQSLKNENDLIKLQAENYKELYRQQQVELAEVQNALSTYGAEFDNNGFLTNYATLTSSILEDYKAEIAKASSDEAKTAYENAYEDFKKQLERYDTLYYNEMKETQDKLDEYNRKIMENNLKMWETEIQVKLDTQQAKRDWADFLKEINDDFKKVYKDLNIEMDHLMTKMETYSGIGTIETDLQAVKDVMIEIDKLNSGQGSDMFESISDAQEKLKELDKQLEDDAKNMKQLWQEAWDTYLEGIDQADSKLDDLMDRFEKINQELEFQGKLVELLYGDEAYSLMDKLYKGQEQAMMNQIGSVKNQVDMWHQLWVESGATMDNQTEWTEDQKKYYKQWMELQNELNNLTTDYIELLQKDYLNTVNDILKKLEISISGQNLEDIKTQWERITANTDKYYDDIEQAYEVQKFANKIDQDIAKATAKNQQKLQAIRDKEISYLREKENLTKYDLDAAEARYQIALKEIALEEAQQNKTSMKLVRNEEGNWSYQYMADADDVAQKQDDLLTSYGDLYKLAGDAYQDNLDSLQSLQETYLQSAKEINSDLTMSEEEKQNKLFELRTWYEDQYNKLAAENELYRQDLATSGAGLLLQVYEQDQTAYEYMTASEQAMLDNLISFSIESYQELENKIITNYNNINTESRALMAEVREDWTASAQQIADSWNADDGQSVKSQVLEAQNEISQAAYNYQKQVDELASEVERDFGPEGISGAIDNANQSTNNLKQSVIDMCVESEKYLTGLKKIVGQVGDSFTSIVGTVQTAINKVQEYLTIVGKAKIVNADGYIPTTETGDLGDIDLDNDGDPLKNSKEDKWVIVGNDVLLDNRKTILQDNHNNGYDTIEQARQEAKSYIDTAKNNGHIYGVGIIQLKDFEKWQKGSIKATPFDTGGYTGAWGDSGKLAFLHQKELVLNADDTANFLSGISLLRNMVSLNGSIEQSIAAAIGNMALQLNGIKAGSVGGVSQAVTTTNGDTYYVNAEFPNANNAEEIKQALLNLPNVVSQYIHKNGL